MPSSPTGGSAKGNIDVQLVVLPGLDHYFVPVPPEPSHRIWERISGEGLRRPMAQAALDVTASWARRTLARRMA